MALAHRAHACTSAAQWWRVCVDVVGGVVVVVVVVAFSGLTSCPWTVQGRLRLALRVVLRIVRHVLLCFGGLIKLVGGKIRKKSKMIAG